jgi:hypothetical protein
MYCLFYNWDTLNGIGNSLSYVMTCKLENLGQFRATFSHQNNGTCSKNIHCPVFYCVNISQDTYVPLKKKIQFFT